MVNIADLTNVSGLDMPFPNVAGSSGDIIDSMVQVVLAIGCDAW
jgi:hypothetical protein